jgi:hypothetical protein
MSEPFVFVGATHSIRMRYKSSLFFYLRLMNNSG